MTDQRDVLTALLRTNFHLGVSILGGNLFSGIILSFSARALDHEPVLTVELAGHLEYGSVTTRDVSLSRGGSVIDLLDVWTYAVTFDCFGGTVIWDPPDTVDVDVVVDETFVFRAVVENILRIRSWSLKTLTVGLLPLFRRISTLAVAGATGM